MAMENNQQKPKFEWLRRYIKWPLVIAIAYLAFVLFFNEYSIARSFELEQKIDSLKIEINNYQDTAQKYKLLNEQLNKNTEEMERVVREQHHMNRVNEDVYIFE
ncbi:MAG: septum formation initiator family protein [Muribaculaceae bacterium]|nr:septum formation initiator family protein [Muribaculaceae bacterium]